MGFVYIWFNKVDGKRYVGRHSGEQSSSYVGSGRYFRRAYVKHGATSFERVILEYVSDIDARDREQFYLDFFKAAKDPTFYNISPSAYGGNNGRDLSGPKNGMFGRKHPNHKPLFGESNGMFGSCRSGAANPNSKRTILTTPDGDVIETPCLKSWCATNQHLFLGEWQKVYQTFRDRLSKKDSRPAGRGNCKGWSVSHVRV